MERSPQSIARGSDEQKDNQHSQMDPRMWKIAQRHLGYTSTELERFKDDPRNADVLSKMGALKRKTIVLEVVESHGCNSRHKVGDKFYFDGAGNLLTERCPKMVCGYSLNAALMMVFSANEMIFAGVDPNQMRFRRAGCFDVGLQCGGWGRIVLELHVEDSSEAEITPKPSTSVSVESNRPEQS